MNRDPKSLKGPYRDLVPKIGTLFLTGHGILWRKALKYGIFLNTSRKQAILWRKCRHTRSGNEIWEHLGPIYTWKISRKYRDILHQIEISLKYRVYRKKQYRSGVVNTIHVLTPRVSVLYRDISRKQYIASLGNIAILQYSENIAIF